MNNLQIFKNEEFGEIRTVTIDNQPYFVGNDVAEVLGYANVRSTVSKKIDSEDRGVAKLETPSGTQEMTVINESGLYSLILGSKLPNAKKFKRWVTSDVLPSIRKNGGYIANQESLSAEQILANAVLLAQNVIHEKDKLLEEQKPKVLFAEAVENSEDVILVKEMATILAQNGFAIGQNQLFQYLRDRGYLCKAKGDMYNLPTRKYEHFFKVTKRVVQNSKGVMVKNTPKITGKGQMFFIKKFNEYLEQGITIQHLLQEGA